MRRFYLVCFLGWMLSGGLFSCSPSPSDVSGYDAELASRLGADEYGMRSYVMVMLESGDADGESQQMTRELMDGHLANISRLAEEGKMVVAGPFGAPSPYRGIFLFNTDNLDSAKSWMDSDPAIQAGILKGSLHPWYGSAALIETAAIHKTIEKTAP